VCALGWIRSLSFPGQSQIALQKTHTLAIITLPCGWTRRDLARIETRRRNKCKHKKTMHFFFTAQKARDESCGAAALILHTIKRGGKCVRWDAAAAQKILDHAQHVFVTTGEQEKFYSQRFLPIKKNLNSLNYFNLK
jgi:hypothetical protein